MRIKLPQESKTKKKELNTFYEIHINFFFFSHRLTLPCIITNVTKKNICFAKYIYNDVIGKLLLFTITRSLCACI